MSSRRLGGWNCTRVRTAAITIARIDQEPDPRGGNGSQRCRSDPCSAELDQKPICAQPGSGSPDQDAARLLDRADSGQVAGIHPGLPLAGAIPQGLECDSPRMCARRSCRFWLCGFRLDHRGVRSNIDAPTRHARGKAGILALLADSKGELVVGNSHAGCPGHWVHNDH